MRFPDAKCNRFRPGSLYNGTTFGYWMGFSDGKEKQKTINIEKIVQVKEKQRKSVIIALMPLVLLTACARRGVNTQPDVVVYTIDIQNRAASEMESGSCPVLTNVFMPNYQVMRDQARVK